MSKEVVVEEASTRYDTDEFYTDPADHSNVCRPESGTLTSFRMLLRFIREVLNKEEAFPQQVQRLSFFDDNKYVPLQKSVCAIIEALESETTGRIVVISGGPGQGKSSMARYLAYLYQDGIPTMHQAENVEGPASLSQKISPDKFVNGVFFLRCGTKVNTKRLLLQLSQDMGLQALSQSILHKNLGDQEDIQDEETILKQVSTGLEHQKVLIILDDVWDPTIMDKITVQAKCIKYLITTRLPKFWTDAFEVKICKPDYHKAKCIMISQRSLKCCLEGNGCYHYAVGFQPFVVG